MFVQSGLFVADLGDKAQSACQVCGGNRRTSVGVWLVEPDDVLYGEFCQGCLVERSQEWGIPYVVVLGNVVLTNTTAWYSPPRSSATHPMGPR